MLSPDQIAHYHEQGYVIVPRFHSPESVELMRRELTRLQQVGLLCNVATEGDGTTTSSASANLQICPLSPHSEIFRALPFASPVVEAVRQLLGSHFYLLLDQIFLKPARHGAGTSWHQDNAYFCIPNVCGGVGMWTAMHKANLANGTLRVIPGSHRVNLTHERDPGSNHHIRCQPSEQHSVAVEVEAGGCIFFNFGIVHSTGANTTTGDRAGLALHFVNGKYREGAQASNGLQLELDGPKADGGLGCYGVDQRGLWENWSRS